VESRIQPAEDTAGLERDWWLRVPAVLQSPRAVFSWFRRDSVTEAEARQEPVLALVLLAGISGILSLDATGTLLDYPTRAGSLPVDTGILPVLIFIQGALYGTAVYWLGGLVVYLGLRGAGSTMSYRTSRQVLAYAAVPLLLPLVLLWPLKLAVYGTDVFRSGGSDAGTGADVFKVLELVFVAWAVGLLVLAIRTVNGWTLPRTLGSLALAAFALVGLSLVAVILSAG
jgi:hypothetical protein